MSRLLLLPLLLLASCSSVKDAVRSSSLNDTNNHPHRHSSGCEHTAIKHEDHIGYLHNGHLHKQLENQVIEHSIAVSNANPAACQNGSTAWAKVEKEKRHAHNASCGHPLVPHGQHSDYVVNLGKEYRLHNVHNDHDDDHGSVRWASGPRIR